MLITYLIFNNKIQTKSYQFDNRFKIGKFVSAGPRLYFPVFPTQKEILGFLNAALSGLLDEQYEPRLHFQIFLNSLKSWEIEIFVVSLIPCFFLDCEDSLSGTKCL